VKFIDTIRKKYTLLEQDLAAGAPQDPAAGQDAAMPQDPAAAAAPQDPAAVDAQGDELEKKNLETINTCVDTINSLVVYFKSKFATNIASDIGLKNSLDELENITKQQTSDANVNLNLLTQIKNKISELVS